MDGIIERLTGVNDPDEELQLQVLKEKQTQNGIVTASNSSRLQTVSNNEVSS